MRILITGVTGFIGSHFAKHVLNVTHDVQVVGLARNSDQNNLKRLSTYEGGVGGCFKDDRFKLVYGDLCDANTLSGICEGIDVVVNFAAKTFVDHSLKDHAPFLESNIIGANRLMDDATRYGVKRFVQVSTDEVYGQILTGSYKEDATLNPRNPYAWTKAAADLDAIWRHRTYGFPVIITRTENNFGPWQHRQKALPTFTRCALAGEPLPVYGDGMHVRCWLDVNEHCRAIWHLVKYSLAAQKENEDAYRNNHNFAGLVEFTSGAILQKDLLGEVFHVAGEDELTNLDLAKIILKTLGKPETQIKFIDDHNIRPGHDRRYALNCDKLKATGFTIKQDLQAKLAEVVQWYASHPEWLR